MKSFAALAALAMVATAATMAQTAQPAPPVRQPPPQSSNSPPNTYVPDHGDNVIVGFPKGATRAPVVTGPVWNGGQKPPTQNPPVQKPVPKPTAPQKPPTP